MDAMIQMHREGRCQVLVTRKVEACSDPAVIVGMNGSNNSWGALSWACAEAIRVSGSVVAVIVIPAKDTQSGCDQSPPSGNNHAVTQDQINWFERLRKDAQKYAFDLGVRLTFAQVQGDPVNELLRIAESHRSNLIAVGRSASAINSFAGSLGRRLVANRQVTVIVDVT